MEKRTQDYTGEILKIIRSNTSPAVMCSRLEDYHANDLAEVMPELTVQERCKLYRILDMDMLSDIFEYTDSDNAAEYLKEKPLPQQAYDRDSHTAKSSFSVQKCCHHKAPARRSSA